MALSLVILMQLHTPFLPFIPFLISLMVSVDVKHHVYLMERAELRSFVKVEVAVLRSLSLTDLMAPVDVKQH